MMPKPTCFDIFAGCGGLSLGLELAGFNVVAACEQDAWAALTFAANHRGVELHECDIRAMSSQTLARRFRGQIDLVAGGPPCQGFSVSGKRQYGISLPGNRLLYEYIRVVEAIRPRAILLENVRGLRTATIDGRTSALETVF